MVAVEGGRRGAEEGRNRDPRSAAILSFKSVNHQHAKWIKFLDYTFHRPFQLASDFYPRVRERNRAHCFARRLSMA